MNLKECEFLVNGEYPSDCPKTLTEAMESLRALLSDCAAEMFKAGMQHGTPDVQGQPYDTAPFAYYHRCATAAYEITRHVSPFVDGNALDRDFARRNAEDAGEAIMVVFNRCKNSDWAWEIRKRLGKIAVGLTHNVSIYEQTAAV